MTTMLWTLIAIQIAMAAFRSAARAEGGFDPR